MTASSAPSSALIGALAVVSAFSMWGVSGVYFAAVGQAPAFEILSHRVVWSLILLIGLLAAFGRLRGFFALFRDAKIAGMLFLSGLLIAANWATFIWSVLTKNALEASIGYYIMPLCMLALGRIFLGEELRRTQLVAIAIVCAGVINEVIAFGDVPWLALIIALTFAAYGLVRKIAPVEAMSGLCAECIFLAPFAVAYFIYMGSANAVMFGHVDLQLDLMLMAAGVVTTVPLLLFVVGTRRLKLGTVGLIQYMNPTIQAATAVFLLGEPFEPAKLITFGLIWIGLLVFSLEGRFTARRRAAVS